MKLQKGWTDKTHENEDEDGESAFSVMTSAFVATLIVAGFTTAGPPQRLSRLPTHVQRVLKANAPLEANPVR